MKHTFTFLAAILITAGLFAQTPAKMTYQAVIRNANGELVSTQVGMRISILQGSNASTASEVYSETLTPIPNQNGLLSIEFGGETGWNDIDWSAGSHFIKTETDPTGGSNYTITGTSQLLSVPYALHAKTAETARNIIITGSEIAFSGWDKNANDDFSGNYNDLINRPDLSTFDQNSTDDFDGDYNNLSNAPDLSNFLTEELDADAGNEIQDLQLSGNILTITNNGRATRIDLSKYLDNTNTQLSDAEIAAMGYIKNDADADSDAYNEIQDLQLTDNILTISKNPAGPIINLRKYLDDTKLSDAEIAEMGYIKNANDADADAGNEIELPTSGSVGDMNYWNGTAWVTIAATINEGATLQMTGSVPRWVGGTTPSVVNTTTGRTWIDRNLGATRVAESKDDEASYGSIYQWGRDTDGHQGRTSDAILGTSNSDTPGHGDVISSPDNDWRSPPNNNLWQGVNGINNPCPDGYRLPTIEEWAEEVASWTSQDADGAFSSPLKLPLFEGSVLPVGFYWSSTVNGTESRYMAFSNDSVSTSNSTIRTTRFSVRCIKD